MRDAPRVREGLGRMSYGRLGSGRMLGVSPLSEHRLIQIGCGSPDAGHHTLKIKLEKLLVSVVRVKNSMGLSFNAFGIADLAIKYAGEWRRDTGMT